MFRNRITEEMLAMVVWVYHHPDQTLGPGVEGKKGLHKKQYDLRCIPARHLRQFDVRLIEAVFQGKPEVNPKIGSLPWIVAELLKLAQADKGLATGRLGVLQQLLALKVTLASLHEPYRDWRGDWLAIRRNKPAGGELDLDNLKQGVEEPSDDGDADFRARLGDMSKRGRGKVSHADLHAVSDDESEGSDLLPAVRKSAG